MAVATTRLPKAESRLPTVRFQVIRIPARSVMPADVEMRQSVFSAQSPREWRAAVVLWAGAERKVGGSAAGEELP